MPTSSAPRATPRAAVFRTNVRTLAACPTCNAPVGRFCVSETGGRRNVNHAARVEAATGTSMDGIDWQAQRIERRNQRERRRKAGLQAFQARYVESY